ncbi:glycosyltransferase [Pseudogemmobacter faecipullorum]|uniref:Glycosyltransferase n=1 Tax=Pseudogemmobacter faecipullorum TaxID=2755041 RepID=A0ABS8CGU4_9RHOB|nr:glycosyltransferase [Pseudogemmobacter faecipullorum]MCB5408589.1 glycosyltransferase [Pseudogemmobacter faecipullorum]
MKIAYLVNTYPLPSQTFIRREILALERSGWTVQRFAMRSGRERLSDPADLAEDGRTEHLLKRGLPGLAKTALPFALRRPRAALAALRLALACGGRGAGGAPGTGGRLRHLVYWLEAAEVARRCHELRMPHIHAHFGTNSTTVAMLAAVIGGLGYSFTTHGPEEFDAVRAHSLAEKLQGADFAVAISAFGRSQLCRQARLEDWPRLHVIHCGIEPWRFAEPGPMPAGPRRLVAIGRLSEQKGFPLLIDAMAMVATALPGLHLTLIGEGELRPAIEARIAALGLGERVTLTGWLDEAGVRSELARSHALVLPSFAEGLPMVIMEAFASGRPAIASAIAGVPELVTPGTGWLVPAGDAAALAEAIRNFAAVPTEVLERMGRDARQAVLREHDIDTEASKLATLFRLSMAMPAPGEDAH